MTTLHLKKSISRPLLRRGFFLIPLALALAWLALSPTARAVLPAPDGGYPGQNTAEGDDALFSLAGGSNNTAIGYQSLYTNTTGVQNTATGSFTLQLNTTGGNNTANGYAALLLNTTGSSNIALGWAAGANLTTGDNNIDIGNEGVAGESNTIRVGTQGTQTKAFIAGISGTPLGPGVAVGVNVNGQLGVKPSSVRYKEAIQPMDKASEAILALKPVTFRYKKELDPKRAPQFGLLAEEVAKVNPDLVVADDQGKPFTVRYEEVNAMLLNEFLKEHRKVEGQQATITQLKAADTKQEAIIAQQQKDFQATIVQQEKEIKALTASLKEQASQIQKVSAQVETSRPAPQIVNNHQ